MQMIQRQRQLKWPDVYYVFTFIVLFSILSVRTSAFNNYGAPCDGNSRECTYHQNLRCSITTKTCQCDLHANLQYDENASIKCATFGGNLPTRVHYHCGNGCTKDQFCSYSGYCQCRDPLIGILKGGLFECRKPVLKYPNQDCYIQEEEAHICDVEKFSYCQNSRCVCFDGYDYNGTTGICKKKESHAKSPDGKGIPGESCVRDDSCVEGLACSSYRVCTCRSNCKYVSREGACDCGEAYISTPAGVFIVGIVFGILSCIFWIFCIRRTYNRLKKKHENNDFDNPVEVAMESQDNSPMNQLSERQDANDKNMTSMANDLPPSYSSVMGNTNNSALGFAPSAHFYSSGTSPWATSYPVQPQTQTENASVANPPLGSETSLPYSASPNVSTSYPSPSETGYISNSAYGYPSPAPPTSSEVSPCATSYPTQSQTQTGNASFANPALSSETSLSYSASSMVPISNSSSVAPENRLPYSLVAPPASGPNVTYSNIPSPNSFANVSSESSMPYPITNPSTKPLPYPTAPSFPENP